jgi:hypothetical protein
MQKIILFGVTHDLQWRDDTGDLRNILEQELAKSNIDLIAEEACGLPTTVAQRLAYKNDKPWIDIDLSIAERKLARIDEELKSRQYEPLNPSENNDVRILYLPNADGMIREVAWAERLLRLQRHVDVVLFLCGLFHVDPFKKKLEKHRWEVEVLDVTQEHWFQKQYGYFRIYEEDGKRWCEIRSESTKNKTLGN